VSILRFCAAEPPAGTCLSADTDRSTRVVIVPTLFHQLKIAGLLLGRTRRAGQLQRRWDWTHGGSPWGVSRCVVP